MSARKTRRTTVAKGSGVVLFSRLFADLSRRAFKRGLPLDYLIAGLVADAAEADPAALERSGQMRWDNNGPGRSSNNSRWR
jgi:hypothetical protein